ncbi:hypothetical protein [Vibrio rarus]|uniref:hypothetical protein n=1 Tax=Vibrio rarus TaxID=413403 RepID=UPI0021C49D6A|nr:hypothetical protein [Vibrio rarus]
MDNSIEEFISLDKLDVILANAFEWDASEIVEQHIEQNKESPRFREARISLIFYMIGQVEH